MDSPHIFGPDAGFLLKETKMLLEREGWKQGSPSYKEGAPTQRCAYVALLDSCSGAIPIADEQGGEDLWEQFALAHKTLSDMVGGSLVSWNDTEGRTVDEVYQLLDTAAEQVNSRVQTVAQE